MRAALAEREGPLRYPIGVTFVACCASPATGTRARLSGRTTASPISRMGTFYEASAVKLQFRVIRHEQQRSDMLLAACRDIRPGRKAADDLLSVPTPWVGHPILCSLCGESRQLVRKRAPSQWHSLLPSSKARYRHSAVAPVYSAVRVALVIVGSSLPR